MPYATPSDLLSLAIPPTTLFEEPTWAPGAISAIIHTGTGLGSIDLDETANPWDGWNVTLTCVRSGELDQREIVNVGPLPRFTLSISTLGTPPVLIATSRPMTPDPKTGRIPWVRGGFALAPSNGTTGAPVTFGAGNAALVLTPLQAGIYVTIVVGTKLGYQWYPGSGQPFLPRTLVLTVTNSTTAVEAAAQLSYTSGNATLEQYLAASYGGDGSGVVQQAPKTLLPFQSFSAGDQWTFTTAASPDVLAAMQAASDLADGYLSGVYKLPLLAWQTDLKKIVCQLARWDLLVRKGMDTSKGFETLDPEGKLGTIKWLVAVQQGQIRPHVQQTPPGATPFPIIVFPIDPLSMEAGTLPL